MSHRLAVLSSHLFAAPSKSLPLAPSQPNVCAKKEAKDAKKEKTADSDIVRMYSSGQQALFDKDTTNIRVPVKYVPLRCYVCSLMRGAHYG